MQYTRYILVEVCTGVYGVMFCVLFIWEMDVMACYFGDVLNSILNTHFVR